MYDKHNSVVLVRSESSGNSADEVREIRLSSSAHGVLFEYVDGPLLTGNAEEQQRCEVYWQWVPEYPGFLP